MVRRTGSTGRALRPSRRPIPRRSRSRNARKEATVSPSSTNSLASSSASTSADNLYTLTRIALSAVDKSLRGQVASGVNNIATRHEQPISHHMRPVQFAALLSGQHNHHALLPPQLQVPPAQKSAPPRTVHPPHHLSHQSLPPPQPRALPQNQVTDPGGPLPQLTPGHSALPDAPGPTDLPRPLPQLDPALERTFAAKKTAKSGGVR